jgi:hypothetical protein
MKKQLFTLISAISVGFTFGQAIPNGGFDNWVVTNYAVPQYYGTSSFNQTGHGNNAIAPYNAVQTSDAFHGAYALQLNTVSGGGGALFAFAANGQPGGGTSVPQGGIPYTQQATGIRFHYKSTIMPGDTAIVLVQFKKAYSLVGSYVFKISSTQSNYTLFSSAFSPALTMAPDSVMFAAASSNALSSNPAIVGNMLQIDSVTFTGVSAQPANLNGDFELWNPQVNYSLGGWIFNDLVKQTTDFYSGSYAMELTTNYDPSNNGAPSAGYATTGNRNGTGGKPYTSMNDTVVFYYKYSPASVNDTATFSAQTKLAGSFIGGAYINLLPAATYTMKKVPLISSSTPDSLIISMYSSKYYPVATANVGSDLKIDNMYLTSNPTTGIKIVDNNNSIAIQPNPNNGAFNVSVKGFTAVTIQKVEIFDVNGKLVETQTYNVATSSQNFDISHLNAGIYNVNITSNGTVISKRVVVTH